jgi:hypothetical protein
LHLWSSRYHAQEIAGIAETADWQCTDGNDTNVDGGHAGVTGGLITIELPQVGATLDVYESVQKHLLPTPTKSHYTFNLRDVSKVFQASSFKPQAEQQLSNCGY